jgi:hypothetical protein
MTRPVSPEGDPGNRKHPRLAADNSGNVLLVWAEGTGWQKGGAIAWQVFDALGRPITGAKARTEGLPVWDFAAAVAGESGFEVVY